MNNQFLLGAIAASTVVIGSAIQAPSAQALTINNPCDASYTSNIDNTGVGTNLGCELGTTNNDFVSSPLEVNVQTIFGYGDWKFLGKDDEGLGGITSFPTSATTGSYDLSSVVQASWTDVMLVFKGGGGNITPETFVSYLIDGTNGWTGTWTTPFTNNNNSNLADVSHISLYYREGTPRDVPTPAAVLPVLGGLFGFARRKKEEASA